MNERREAEPTSEPVPEVYRAAIRRAPKWGAFIVVGALIGLIVTIVVTTAFPADPRIGMTMLVLVVGIFGVSGGAALGAIAAIIADRVSRRRARQVTVERGEVHAEPVAEAPTPGARDAEDAADAADAPPASAPVDPDLVTDDAPERPAD